MNTKTSQEKEINSSRFVTSNEAMASCDNLSVTTAAPGVGRLRGRVALISVNDAIVGKVTALAVAREGGNVAIVCRTNSDYAQEIRSSVEAAGGNCLIIAGDVSDEKFCSRSVELIIDRLGRLDMFVNDDESDQNPDPTSGQDNMSCLERVFREYSAHSAV